MKKVFISFLLMTSISTLGKSTEISHQLECLRNLNTIDNGEYQADKNIFGIQIKNKGSAKTLILDRKNNEYIIYSKKETITCDIPRGIESGESLSFFTKLKFKVDGVTVAVKTELEKKESGRLSVRRVSLGHKKNNIFNLSNDIQCNEKIESSVRDKLEKFAKHRIKKITDYCKESKNTGKGDDWGDFIDEMYCREALTSCLASSDLKLERLDAI